MTQLNKPVMIEDEVDSTSMGSSPFPHLLSPLIHGRLSIRNRVMFSGHITLYAKDGLVSPRQIRYYSERAKGGVGIVVTEAAAVHPTTVKFPEMIRAFEPRVVDSMQALAEAVHVYDSKVVMQLAHGGARMSAIDSDLPLLAPSAVLSSMYNEVPRAMTLGEIKSIQEGFALSARHAAQTDLDGVEVHSAHGYLPVQFLSPLHNHRSDHYGGSFENRARFLLEVLEMVRAELGSERILGIKVNGSDLAAGGCTTQDYIDLIQLIEQTQTVDYLSVSVGTSRTNHKVVPAMPVEEGVNVEYAARIKDTTTIPVFTVGRIYRPEHAEALIADGIVDGVSMARALIADPDWVNKAASNPELIRPCIAVNQGCFGYLYRSRPITCLVNPKSGKEFEERTARSENSRRIAVVGGGPAGCEAAITAAEMGHDVTLFESSDRLGGLLNWASSIESRKEWRDLLIFHRSELSRLHVDVRLQSTADAEALLAGNFDEILLAIGASACEVPESPPGGPLVTTNIEALALVDVKDRQVVVVDFLENMQAYVPAEYLASQGANVTIVTSKPAIGGKLDQPSSVSLLERLGELNVHIQSTTSVTQLVPQGVEVRDVFGGSTETLPAEIVVWVNHRVAPDRLLAESLEAHDIRVHEIGDCLAPRSALEAIREGQAVSEHL
jgi:2,4-dienoyl-CoA reductase-like NADH-dependent reductase (Old Yellow Enzyme family)